MRDSPAVGGSIPSGGSFDSATLSALMIQVIVSMAARCHTGSNVDQEDIQFDLNDLCECNPGFEQVASCKDLFESSWWPAWGEGYRDRHLTPSLDGLEHHRLLRLWHVERTASFMFHDVVFYSYPCRSWKLDGELAMRFKWPIGLPLAMHDSFTPWFDMANDKWRFGISEDGAGTQFALVLQRQPAADRMVAANFVFKLGKHLPKLEIDGQPSQIDRRVSIDGSHIFGMDESTESMHLWSPKQMALLQTSPNEWRLQTCGVLGYKTSDAETHSHYLKITRFAGLRV